MKFNNIKLIAITLIAVLTFIGCSDDDLTPFIPDMDLDFSGNFIQKDQMGRPAVNTVFISSASKDMFNVTIPSEQSSTFQSQMEANLLGLSPAYANGGMNALGQNAAAFTGLLSTDVLNVSLIGTTTFFDGTNVLTGRTLADDVITVELLLIFGGEDFSENPTLTDDHVDANDKNFSNSFPYLATPW